MIIAAENIKPSHIANLRNDAGGLLCLAIDGYISTKLGLSYIHDILNCVSNDHPLFTTMTNGRAPYGDKPSFSISVNHRDTYTGITDYDRALTISRLASVCKNIFFHTSPHSRTTGYFARAGFTHAPRRSRSQPPRRWFWRKRRPGEYLGCLMRPGCTSPKATGKIFAASHGRYGHDG